MSEKPTEQARGVSPISGVAPPIESRWKPGQSGNPLGRKTAGATLKEWCNVLSEQGLSEKELRLIAKDKELPWPKRAAANRILRMLEIPDLADFQDAVDGVEDLKSLRNSGLNTEVVKKMKSKTRTIPGHDGEDGIIEVEREIELFDRSGDDFDRISDRTDGKPNQTITQTNDGQIEVVVKVVKGVSMDDL